MKFLIILSFSCVVYASLEEDRQKWLNFKNEHGKSYRNLKEEQQRFSIFQENLRTIEQHNSKYERGETTYTKGVNRFTDLTREEFVAMLTRHSRPNLKTNLVYQKSDNAKIPESIDWREQGAVTEVKNQGDCGSCWAFSVTGTLESFHYLKNKKMVRFSEQQLVDCCEYTAGCWGGDEGVALKYVVEEGIQSEDSYPYLGIDGICSYNESAVSLKIKNYVQIKNRDEDALVSAIGTLGPISVALDASDLSSYKSGVYTNSNCEKDATNHAVLAVGYGKDEDTGLDYYWVKNSWGADWGDNGYFKIQRGTNECAISTDCVYPVL